MGSTVLVEGKTYAIRGILPGGFEPLSRELALYLVEPQYFERDAYAVVDAKADVTQALIDNEFTQIAQNVTYYFLQGQIRFGFAQSDLWSPVRSFAVAAAGSALMLLMVFRLKWRSLLPSKEAPILVLCGKNSAGAGLRIHGVPGMEPVAIGHTVRQFRSRQRSLSLVALHPRHHGGVFLGGL
jgi:hypothetical protein